MRYPVSVVVCSHNPRPDYLHSALEALKSQTLPLRQWELLVIDNASSQPISSKIDLGWHPCARHVREERLGLTSARLCGIRESTGEALIFVDDDNVLAASYLSKAVSIFREWPMLGAFGANIKGEFEVAPPAWVTPYLDALAVHELDRDYWSNVGGWSLATPYGAGLCVRRLVAEDYAEKAMHSPIRRSLDRSGTGMGAGGDLDLAWCAIDLGMGTGRFTSLELTHLIPKARLTEEYIVRLQTGIAAAHEVLSTLRNSEGTPRQPRWRRQIRLVMNLARARKLERTILLRAERARSEVRRLVSQSNICESD